MSEQILAAQLRQEYLEACSAEDRPGFEHMEDKDIIERMIHCSYCEERILAYEMAIIANTGEELSRLMVQFGDQKHFKQCLPAMEQFGLNGMKRLWKLRDKHEEEQLEQGIAFFQALFEDRKHEFLDIIEQPRNNEHEKLDD